MGPIEIGAMVTQAGAMGVLAAIVIWLAPKALKSASQSRQIASRQHTEDINRICAVFQEQMRYEREACNAQFENLMETIVAKMHEHHLESLRLLDMFRERRA